MAEPNTTPANPAQPRITGYRELDGATVEVINRIKDIENTVGDMIAELRQVEGVDPRAVSLARTHLQEGFSWASRSVAQPESRL